MSAGLDEKKHIFSLLSDALKLCTCILFYSIYMLISKEQKDFTPFLHCAVADLIPMPLPSLIYEGRPALQPFPFNTAPAHHV